MSNKESNPYQPFNTFIFRSPFFPLSLLVDWLAELDRSPGYLKEILGRSDIHEAIFLASPVLYNEITKYLQDSLKPKDNEKFFYSIIKYLSRMASRCTPFGLFAGCSVGHLADCTSIRLHNSKHYLRHTRLDMNYLCTLAQDIAKRKELRHRLFYYSNNNSYVVGNKLRYVEYSYHNNNRKHDIVAIDNSEYLQCILSAARDGAIVEQLAALLTDDEISHSEAIEFIDDLIDCQLLVSELEPSVTGEELLEQLIHVLDKFDDQQEMLTQLKSLSSFLSEIDTKPIGTTIPLYDKINTQIKAFGTIFNVQYLFQSDMIKPCEKAEVDRKIIDEILEAITFLDKISSFNQEETLLDKFITPFIKRYEEREIPLAQLLDIEMGLELSKLERRGDISPLLEGIPFGLFKQQRNTSHTWNGFQSLLHRKIIEALMIKQQEVIFTDDDVRNVSAKWDDLPYTIAALCEIFEYNPNGILKIYLHIVNGSSAANLLGRFCHADQKIYQAVMDIINEEEQVLPDDKLYAEIVHLPESRTGNILARPILRQYEIPYFAKPAVKKEFQLEISDLMVSIKHGKFILRSKKLNKEIIPRLTTAHNYNYPNVMPIYQFLCNLQCQHQGRSIGLIFSDLFNEFSYLPRISYKNVILSLACWHVKPDEIKPIAEIDEAAQALQQWKARTGIPRFVVLPDGDNKLFADTESLTSMRTLYSVVKKRQQFTLYEFPFNMGNAILKNEQGTFTNEMLFTFHKTQSI